MIKKTKALITRVSSSKDGKTLASNFGYLMLLQIAGYIFPLITIPYLARVIGVEGFGKIAFAAAVIVWFQTIADWGFNYTATREVARNRDNLDKVSEIFSNVLWARLFLMLVSFGVLSALIIVFPYFYDNKVILLVTFCLIPGQILFPDWFFQAMERMKYITIFNLISKAIFTALIFVFVTNKSDYFLPPLFTSLGFILSGLVAMYIILVKWRIKLHPPRLNPIFLTIKNSTDVFINNIVRNLYNSFSVVLLGFLGGNVANGILSAGRTFISISQQFMTIVDRVFFPFLSRRLNEHELYAKGSLIIALFGTIMLFVSAPLIIEIFYTEEFKQAIPILQVMSISLISTTLSAIYGTNYLILVGQEKKLRNITLVVSIFGFLSAFPLIYYFSYWGAAINIVCAQTALGFSTMFFAKKIML